MLRSLLVAATLAAITASPIAAQSNIPFCAGDGTQVPACPCANNGMTAHGCDNSAATGGGHLTSSGTSNPDTIVFTVAGELPSVLSILYQADSRQGSVAFGDGIQCLTGTIRKLFIRNAVNGMLTFPESGEPSISQRSAALGDTIQAGSFRYYNVQYRDRDAVFCPSPTGGTWNTTNHYMISW